MSITLAYLSAVLASVLLNLGLVVQTAPSRAADMSSPSAASAASAASSSARARESGARLLTRLVRSPIWLLGTLMVNAAWALEIVALIRLPVTFVQPALAAGIVLVPWAAARRLRERPRGRDMVALVVIIAGVTLLARATHGVDADHIVGAWRVIGTAVSVLIVGALIDMSPSPALLRALAAGTCFGLTTPLGKIVALPDVDLWVRAVTLGAIAITATLAVALQMSALRRATAVRVVVITMTANLVMSQVLGRFWYGEYFAHALVGFGALLIIIAAAITVARGPATQVTVQR